MNGENETMTNPLILADPASGQTVRIGVMRLPQKCQVCHEDLLVGHLGIAIAGASTPGWCCYTHHERLLLSLDMTEAFKARWRLRREFSGMSPMELQMATDLLSHNAKDIISVLELDVPF
jgi:hypothetical protein